MADAADSTAPATWSERLLLWGPGMVVGCGAGVVTAHGLFVVATASGVPVGIAWLYPVITDGLALVAYSATHRLRGRGAIYAWAVVVLAAGLSGLAQAIYLAGEAVEVGRGTRFGVGAWPAIAAAVSAHLIHLLGRSAAGGSERPSPTNPILDERSTALSPLDDPAGGEARGSRPEVRKLGAVGHGQGDRNESRPNHRSARGAAGNADSENSDRSRADLAGPTTPAWPP